MPNIYVPKNVSFAVLRIASTLIFTTVSNCILLKITQIDRIYSGIVSLLLGSIVTSLIMLPLSQWREYKTVKYYAMPFLKDARQNIVRGDMEYARSARHAWHKAQAMMTADVVGSIAFSRTEGSISGTLGAPIVLKAFGEVEKTMKNF